MTRSSGGRILASLGRRSAPGTQQRPAERQTVADLTVDIPQARRSGAALKPRGSRGSRTTVGLGLGLGLALALTAVAISPGLLQRNGTTQLHGGVRPDRDGRLLGHFPYRELPRSELIAVAPGLELQREAARALLAMQEAARADGVALVVLSGFRSIDLQKRLFFEVKSARNQTALERARVSAPPGYSEHSTGYAVDLADGAAPSSDLSTDFDQTAAFAWLQNNARRFHFTLSFPQGNAQGVNYEPWHWRYEGSAQALRTFEPAQRLSR
jgi:D-alanyl-D-alanine carboxypeptidase